MRRGLGNFPDFPAYFHRKIEETELKEIASCFTSTPHLLVVFTQQLEILVTSLYSHCLQNRR